LAASAQNILFLETLKLSKSTVVKEQIIVEENGECFGIFGIFFFEMESSKLINYSANMC
jgi:hypothetical protein